MESESRRRAKPVGTRRRQSRQGDADTEPDSDAAAGAPQKRHKRPRSPSSQASDSADSADHRSTSRHRPVSNLAIYNTYANEGQILADVRRRFQTLIFARDGSPIKTLTVHRHLNFKLTLIAAKDVMDCTRNSRLQWTTPSKTLARSKRSLILITYMHCYIVCVVGTPLAPTNAHGPCAALQRCPPPPHPGPVPARLCPFQSHPSF